MKEKHCCIYALLNDALILPSKYTWHCTSCSS